MTLIVKQMPEISQHFCRLEAEGIDIPVLHYDSYVIFRQPCFERNLLDGFPCKWGAQRRKKYAPPVFALALAYFHPHRIIIACRNGKAIVNTGIKLHIGEI